MVRIGLSEPRHSHCITLIGGASLEERLGGFPSPLCGTQTALWERGTPPTRSLGTSRKLSSDLGRWKLQATTSYARAASSGCRSCRATSVACHTRFQQHSDRIDGAEAMEAHAACGAAASSSRRIDAVMDPEKSSGRMGRCGGQIGWIDEGGGMYPTRGGAAAELVGPTKEEAWIRHGAVRRPNHSDQ